MLPFAERLGRSLRRGMQASLRLPSFLDPLKALGLLLAVAFLKAPFMRKFRPQLASTYGFELTGAPTESILNGVIFYRGVFEPILSDLIDRVVGEGDVCVDAGANAGYFALLLARKVGPRGRVFAIEPAPGNLRRIVRNVAHNGFEGRVSIVGQACTDTAGISMFYVNTRNDMHCRLQLPGPWSLERWLTGGRASWRAVTVATNTLSGMLGPRAAEVTFVKLDIEGAEHLVVRDLIARCVHPRLMVALEAKAPHVRQTLQAFEEAGFHLYDLRNDYRWLLNLQVGAPVACTYESIYARRFMADVLVTRQPLGKGAAGGPSGAVA